MYNVADPSPRLEKATFAAGCFWDVEAAFRKVEGVLETVPGYTGGSIPHPRYEQVESGTTGHVEAVGIVFDPSVVSFTRLLDSFWDMHNPTHAGGQGEYTGIQYHSVIFCHREEQKQWQGVPATGSQLGKNTGTVPFSRKSSLHRYFGQPRNATSSSLKSAPGDIAQAARSTNNFFQTNG
jgi:methionine-S-sulfoxide reductase